MGSRSATWPRRRARLTVVSLAVVVVLLHLLLNIQLDSRWHDVRNPHLGPEHSRKAAALNQYIADTGTDPPVLALGSSRMNMAFRAEMLESGQSGQRPLRAFNFALFSSGPIATSLYGQHLLESGVRPDVVLVELFPPMLDGPGPGHAAEEQQQWLPQHERFADLPRLCRYHSRPGLALWQWGRSRTLLAAAENSPLRAKFAPPWQKTPGPPAHVDWPMDRCGWVRAPLTASRANADTTRIIIGAISQRSPGLLEDYRVGEGVRRAIDDLLGACRQRGVHVVLLVPPTESHYRPVFNLPSTPRGERMEDVFQAYVRELVQTHGCSVIDARDWVPDEGFFDSTHLRYDGAEQFTLRLHGELIGILSRSGAAPANVASLRK